MSNPECNELCKLININEDACEFYETARETTKDQNLQRTFRDLEIVHKNVIANLQRIVREKGGDAEAYETIKGQMNQFWGELMTRISENPDEMLIYQLEEVEDRCLKSMKEAMESDDITAYTKTFLDNELTALKKSHAHMRSLKEISRAA